MNTIAKKSISNRNILIFADVILINISVAIVTPIPYPIEVIMLLNKYFFKYITIRFIK